MRGLGALLRARVTGGIKGRLAFQSNEADFFYTSKLADADLIYISEWVRQQVSKAVSE